jgi:hypothetical protein
MMGRVALALAATASAASAASTDERPLVDAGYRTACGPISIYATLRALGRQATLDRIIADCGWREGEQTPFSTLVEVLRRHRGIEVQAVRLSPDQLLAWFARDGRRAAILPIRKYAGTDHSICVIGAEGQRFRVADYPELAYVMTAGQLSDVWNGEAILVTEKSVGSAWTAVLAILPGAAIGSFLGLARRFRTSASRRSPEAVETP